MRGLRTQEGEKFERFFELVQKEALKRGCVFFLNSGEGHIFENEDMVFSDLNGWLIPAEKAEEFNKKYMDWQEDSEDLEDWDDCFCWEEWEDKENPKISFVWYD